MLKLTTAEIDAMVTAEVMAEVEEDAQRFRWLMTQPHQEFAQIQHCAHLALKLREWPDFPNCSEYDRAFYAQVRAEIDRRRGAR